MTKLPRISGRECAKALAKIDFHFVRQKGSHMVYRRDDPYAQVVIPDHKEIHAGTLRDIIRDAGLSVEEFVALL
jgi:predicted RNA binding protein YcfA (HicA-like mRNA interferase family)